MDTLTSILSELQDKSTYFDNKPEDFHRLVAQARKKIADLMLSEDKLTRLLQIYLLPTAIAKEDARLFKDGVNVRKLAHAIREATIKKLGGGDE